MLIYVSSHPVWQNREMQQRKMEVGQITDPLFDDILKKSNLLEQFWCRCSVDYIAGRLIPQKQNTTCSSRDQSECHQHETNMQKLGSLQHKLPLR